MKQDFIQILQDFRVVCCKENDNAISVMYTKSRDQSSVSRS